MTNLLRTSVATAAAGALTVALLTLSGGTAAAAPVGPVADFNGDGYPDLAISAPHTTINNRQWAGTVAVVYGSANGLNKNHRQWFSQDTAGVPGVAEADDEFGHALTTGDMDGDGFTDLVIATPNERIGTTAVDGTITILWGGLGGLSGGRDLSGPFPFEHDGTGRDVVAGDYNGDGRMDLATDSGTGLVLAFYGPFSRDGKAASREELFSEEAGLGSPGEHLIAGDVTGDGADELVVLGIVDWEPFPAASALYRGGTGGLTPAGKLPGGHAGTIADVNKDGYGDIVTGQEWEKSVSQPNGRLGGSVTVTYGSATGLSTTRAPVTIHQDTAGVPGTAEAKDYFGGEVSAGDVNGDGWADVVVGVEGEDIDGVADVGAVVVLRGSAAGLTGTGAVAYNQNTEGIPGGNETRDGFGHGAKLIDADAGGRSELVVGAPFENSGGGMVWYLKSASTGGLTPTGSTYFGQTALGGPAGPSWFGLGFQH